MSKLSHEALADMVDTAIGAVIESLPDHEREELRRRRLLDHLRDNLRVEIEKKFSWYLRDMQNRHPDYRSNG